MSQNSSDKILQRFLDGQKVCTDTRKLNADELFIALKGPNFNGNEYAAKALDSGAATAVVDDVKYFDSQDDRYILVDDGLKALQQLASNWRKQLDIPVIGITGSNGKTTTKELVLAVLSAMRNSVASAGNLNNHIGVPLSVLAIQEEHEIAVIEMGANHIGEIEKLCQIASPTHGLVTNVGKDHLEGFGSLEGSKKANTELLDYLKKNGGTIFHNTAESILQDTVSEYSDVFTFPNTGDYFECKFAGASPFVVYQDENGNEVTTSLSGAYNFQNIAAALCIGKYFNVDPDSANKAVASYTPSNNRSQWLSTGRNHVLLDAYNANPTSMEKALSSFDQIEASRKMVILGDMFELGDFSQEEHAALGSKLNDLGAEEIILCGHEMRHAAQACPGATHFAEKHSLIDHLAKYPPEGFTVLIKGSRGMALEDCLDFL